MLGNGLLLESPLEVLRTPHRGPSHLNPRVVHVHIKSYLKVQIPLHMHWWDLCPLHVPGLHDKETGMKTSFTCHCSYPKEFFTNQWWWFEGLYPNGSKQHAFCFYNDASHVLKLFFFFLLMKFYKSYVSLFLFNISFIYIKKNERKNLSLPSVMAMAMIDPLSTSCNPLLASEHLQSSVHIGYYLNRFVWWDMVIISGINETCMID
jgi:hypothetical protein